LFYFGACLRKQADCGQRTDKTASPKKLSVQNPEKPLISGGRTDKAANHKELSVQNPGKSLISGGRTDKVINQE